MKVKDFIAEQREILGAEYDKEPEPVNSPDPKKEQLPEGHVPYICAVQLGGCGHKFTGISPAACRFATGNTVVCGNCGKRRSVCFDQRA